MATDTSGLPNTTGTAASSLPSLGGTSSAGLSEWAAPYITGMLGQGQALAASPYQAYGGALTAGPSDIQNNLFSGLASLTFPQNLGQSFTSTGAPAAPMSTTNPYPVQPIGTGQPTGAIGDMSKTDGTMTSPAVTTTDGMTAPTNVASQYMNPYLQSVLGPQLEELRRQNAITNAQTNAGLTSQGAFGGGRQAIMNAENNRNLMQTMNQTVGTGYANAFDKAQQQFNAEQQQSQNLANLMGQQGAAQQGINQAATAANVNEFNTQRDYPQKMLQFEQSLLQGLPIASVTNTPSPQSTLGNILSTSGGILGLANNLYGTNQGAANLQSLMQNLGFGSSGG